MNVPSARNKEIPDSPSISTLFSHPSSLKSSDLNCLKVPYSYRCSIFLIFVPFPMKLSTLMSIEE